MKKVNMCRFGSGNWLFSCIFGQVAEAANSAPAREECNKYDLTADP
jgi:hypothetical protein